MAKAAEKNGPSTLVVDLGEERYRKLQDESIRRSRRTRERVPMTEIARSAIDRELSRTRPR